jgi:hypothetical protein
MKIVNLQQNSEEWFEFRQGKIGGSKLSKLYPKTMPRKDEIVAFCEEEDISIDPKVTIDKILAEMDPQEIGKMKSQQSKLDGFYQLLAERVSRPLTENDYADRLNGQPFSYMARGHILEPEALEKFKEHTGKKTTGEKNVWVSDNNPNIYVSPDDSIKIKGKYVEAIEVKCPSSHVVLRAWHENRYPKEYEEQVRQYFIVNEDLQKLYFVIYTDLIPSLPIQIFEVTRDSITEDLALYISFESEVLQEIDRLSEKLAF